MKSTMEDDALFGISRDGLTGYVDVQGRVVIPPSFVSAGGFSEGLADVHTGRQFPWRDASSRWGYMDRTCCLIIPQQFQMPKTITGRIDIHFSEGWAAACNGRRCGYIDHSGEFVIDPVFDGCSAFRDGIATVQQSSRYGCINTKGEFLIPLQSNLLFDFQEGIAPIQIGDKWNYIDRNGKLVLRTPFTLTCLHVSALGFREGLAPAEIGGGVAYVNHSGEVVIPPRYSGITEPTQEVEGFVFSEGLAAYAGEGPWGYIDRTGEFAIAPKFEHLGAFHEGLAAVYFDGLWKYIGPDGTVKFTVPGQEAGKHPWPGPQGMYCGGFGRGLASISILGEGFGSPSSFGYVNGSGEYVWPPQG
ncbi:MAG: WG repeat-containing protein [Acidobacteriota bacterium]|nr:WG repeat-containing protein [Acidobacteriota bacterium]